MQQFFWASCLWKRLSFWQNSLDFMERRHWLNNYMLDFIIAFIRQPFQQFCNWPYLCFTSQYFDIIICIFNEILIMSRWNKSNRTAVPYGDQMQTTSIGSVLKIKFSWSCGRCNLFQLFSTTTIQFRVSKTFIIFWDLR